MMNAADVVLDGISVIDGEFLSTDLNSSVFPPSLGSSGSISSLLPNMRIFSPQDLRVPESVISASGSASTDTLTPELTCNDSSNLFGNGGLFNHKSADADADAVKDNLHPLFRGDSNDPVAAKPERSHETGSNSVIKSYRHNTRQSSGFHVCSCHHTTIAGVNGSERYKPLLLTTREQGNQVAAAKRVRNTIAARKSRERKAQRMDELKNTITKLEAERDDWKRAALSRFEAQ